MSLLIYTTNVEYRNDGWLLGDSAYALKKYMMTPKLSPSNAAEESYNAAHSKTRVVVERALGVCKSRFRYPKWRGDQLQNFTVFMRFTNK